MGTQGGGRGCSLALPGPSVFTLSLSPVASEVRSETHLPMVTLTFLSHVFILPDCHVAPPGLLDGAGKAIKLALSHLLQKEELGEREEWWVLVSPQGHSLQFSLSPSHPHALTQGHLHTCYHTVVKNFFLQMTRPGIPSQYEAQVPASSYKRLVWLGSNSSSAHYYSRVVFQEKQHNVTASLLIRLHHTFHMRCTSTSEMLDM